MAPVSSVRPLYPFNPVNPIPCMNVLCAEKKTSTIIGSTTTAAAAINTPKKCHPDAAALSAEGASSPLGGTTGVSP